MADEEKTIIDEKPAPVDSTPTADPMAILQAQIEEGKKMVAPIPLDGEPRPVNGNVAEAARPEAKPTVPEEPAQPKTPGDNKDSLQQFRGKDGKVDLTKIQKANEHLEMSTADKEKRLIELNKELMRKHTKVSQELSQAKKEALPDPLDNEDFRKLSPEFKKKVLEDMEKDPVEAIFKVADAIAQKRLDERVKPLESLENQRKEESVDSRNIKDLNRLVEQGHNWVMTSEGQALLQKTLDDRPWLRQSDTPFSDALRFLDVSQAQEPGPAQSGQKVPILGSFHSAPPPSSAPPVSAEVELENLAAQLNQAMKIHDMVEAANIKKQMDKVYRKVYG